MSNFEKHRRNGTSWFSAPFFTHTRGYKLCLCVIAAGHKDTQKGHVSVFIAVMKGPHDSQLPWPMEGVVHVRLLNQLNSEHDLNHCMTITLPDSPLFPFNSTLRVTEEDEKFSMKTPMGVMSSAGIGAHKFFSLEKLTKTSSSCQYLKDDCIFFEVEYGKGLDDFVPPESFAYKKPEQSKPIKQDSSQRFYRTPQQVDVLSDLKEKEPTASSLQNRPINYSSPGDDGISKDENQQARRIPEAVTKL